MRSVYSCSINICALGFNGLLESIFSLLLLVELFSLQKAVEMLKKMVVTWQEVRWIWQMRQNIVAQFVQLLKCWLCNCPGDELDPFCWPVVTPGIAVFRVSHWFAEHTSQIQWFLWNSESCSGSDWQQITKQWPWPFLVQFGFGKCFWAPCQSKHWAN